MSIEVKKEIQLEIAHVLFIDIVGYSKLLINEQRALLETANQIVRSTDEFQRTTMKIQRFMAAQRNSLHPTRQGRKQCGRDAAKSATLRARPDLRCNDS